MPFITAPPFTPNEPFTESVDEGVFVPIPTVFSEASTKNILVLLSLSILVSLFAPVPFNTVAALTANPPVNVPPVNGK